MTIEAAGRERRLTQFANCGGCAAKVGPVELRAIMSGLPAMAPRPADLLVGTETSDDAGIYRVADDLAIVCTADFITPLVDDPHLFGQIAAANALSDVYAMGGIPKAALALCMFPKELDPGVARSILEGGQSKVAEAGAAVVGGHTVRSEELFYGLSVTGTIDPRRILRNVGAHPGDVLLLTKPLGSGLIINGVRKGVLAEREARPVFEALAMLNRAAAEAIGEMFSRVHAVTDVTGFGLSGHGLEMAVGSNVTLSIELASLPRFPLVEDMVQRGVTTRSTAPNRESAARRLFSQEPLSPFWDALVHDPQTSGALLIAVEAEAADHLLTAMRKNGVHHATQIGRVEELSREGHFLRLH
jgi:selenide,water dikinase